MQETIGEAFFRLILCQTRPGTENAVLNDMRERIEPESLWTYAALSEYDILAITPLEADGPPFREYYDCRKDYIRDLQETLCFSWTGHEADTDALSAHPTIAVTFMKIAEDIVRSSGLGAEWSVADWIEGAIDNAVQSAVGRRGDDIRTIILGTLGWPELVVIWLGPKLSTVLKAIVELRKESPSRVPGLRSDSDQLFCYTYTVPCVRSQNELFDFVTVQDEGTHADMTQHLKDRVWATVQVSCKPTGCATVRDHVRSVSADIECGFDVLASYGRRDLLVGPANEYTTVECLVRLLRELRSGHIAENIYLTHTVVCCYPDVHCAEDSMDPETVKPPPVPDSHPDAESGLDDRRPQVGGVRAGGADRRWRRVVDRVRAFRHFEQSLGNRCLEYYPQLAQMVLRMNAVRATKELAGVADDLMPFVENAVAHALRTAETSPDIRRIDARVRDEYEIFQGVPRLFYYALQQRLAGANLGAANPGRAFTFLHSVGIQRIIGAGNSIPRSMLQFEGLKRATGLEWDGFVTFGLYPGTLRLSYGAMNVPAADILDPAAWWRLGHETGHEFNHRAQLRAVPGVADLIAAAQSADGLAEGDTGEAAATQVAYELSADAFEFEFVFYRDFGSYLNVVWHFFDDYLEGMSVPSTIEQALLRTVFIYFYYLEREGALLPFQSVHHAITEGQPLLDTLFLHEGLRADVERSLVLRAFAEQGSLAEIVKYVASMCAETAPKLASSIRKADTARLADMYAQYEPLRSELADIFATLSAARRNTGSPDYEDLAERLHRGEIILEEDTKPIDMCLALQKRARKQNRRPDAQQALHLRASVAAVLSMWHRWQAMLSRWPDDYPPD